MGLPSDHIGTRYIIGCGYGDPRTGSQSYDVVGFMSIDFVELTRMLVGGLIVRTSNAAQSEPEFAVFGQTWQRARLREQPSPPKAVLADYECDSTRDGTHGSR